MRVGIFSVMLIVLSLSTSLAQLTPVAYSQDGKYYLCWDTSQASYLAAMIDNGLRNDSTIQALQTKMEAMQRDIDNLEAQLANADKDRVLANKQNLILMDALKAANRLIRWLKLQSKVLAGTAAAILLYSLTIGSQK